MKMNGIPIYKLIANSHILLDVEHCARPQTLFCYESTLFIFLLNVLTSTFMLII